MYDKNLRQTTPISFWIMVSAFMAIIVSLGITNHNSNSQKNRSINNKTYVEFGSGRRLDIQVHSDLPWHCFLELDEVLVDGKKFSPTDFIFPGKHRITVHKKGFEELNLQVNVPIGSIPFTVKITLISKPRPVAIKVTHNFMVPGKKFQPQQFTLGNRKITAQEKFKPGSYELVIIHPGFREIREQFVVYPGEGILELARTLYAKPRTVTWNVPRNIYGCSFFEAEQVLLNGKIATPDAKFTPGIQYHLVARFRRYNTMKKTITIPPGEGPYPISVAGLIPYKKYDLRVGRKYHDMTVDKVKFPIEIFIDGNLLEPHHIIPGDGFNVINYEFYAPQSIRSIRIVCGFYYDESSVKDAFEFRNLRKIDSSRFLKHLQSLPKPSALYSVIRLLEDRQDKRKILHLSKANRQHIVNLLHSLSLSKDLHVLREKVTKKLLTKK